MASALAKGWVVRSSRQVSRAIGISLATSLDELLLPRHGEAPTDDRVVDVARAVDDPRRKRDELRLQLAEHPLGFGRRHPLLVVVEKGVIYMPSGSKHSA